MLGALCSAVVFLALGLGEELLYRGVIQHAANTLGAVRSVIWVVSLFGIQHAGTARRWLEELGDLRPGWREGEGLPTAVLSMTGALRRALGPGMDREGSGVPRLLARARSGRWLVLHGAWTESAPDRGSETMIVIEAATHRRPIV